MLQIGQKYHRSLANGEVLSDVIISEDTLGHYQELEAAGVNFERVAGVVIHRRPIETCSACEA